ncbi:hypothetical protein F5Y17DRAFT_39809 [Xylariaceae sp. FL0594]|nr:hypothetical protein F5Y17DRAFT_39809 [Xylariaceae sp. FL0594]
MLRVRKKHKPSHPRIHIYTYTHTTHAHTATLSLLALTYSLIISSYLSPLRSSRLFTPWFSLKVTRPHNFLSALSVILEPVSRSPDQNAIPRLLRRHLRRRLRRPRLRAPHGRMRRRELGWDAVVARSPGFSSTHGHRGNDPHRNPFCGQQIQINHGERIVNVTVEDRCEDCASSDLDVPIGVFERLANPVLLRVEVTWNWQQEKGKVEKGVPVSLWAWGASHQLLFSWLGGTTTTNTFYTKK